MSVSKTDKYYRDPNNGALISNDNEGLKSYRMQKQKASQITEMSKDINNLKEEMLGIRDALHEILNSFKQEK